MILASTAKTIVCVRINTKQCMFYLILKVSYRKSLMFFFVQVNFLWKRELTIIMHKLFFIILGPILTHKKKYV